MPSNVVDILREGIRMCFLRAIEVATQTKEKVPDCVS